MSVSKLPTFSQNAQFTRQDLPSLSLINAAFATNSGLELALLVSSNNHPFRSLRLVAILWVKHSRNSCITFNARNKSQKSQAALIHVGHQFGMVLLD